MTFLDYIIKDLLLEFFRSTPFLSSSVDVCLCRIQQSMDTKKLSFETCLWPSNFFSSYVTARSFLKSLLLSNTYPSSRTKRGILKRFLILNTHGIVLSMKIWYIVKGGIKFNYQFDEAVNTLQAVSSCRNWLALLFSFHSTRNVMSSYAGFKVCKLDVGKLFASAFDSKESFGEIWIHHEKNNFKVSFSMQIYKM